VCVRACVRVCVCVCVCVCVWDVINMQNVLNNVWDRSSHLCDLSESWCDLLCYASVVLATVVCLSVCLPQVRVISKQLNVFPFLARMFFTCCRQHSKSHPPCRWKIFPERGVVVVRWPVLEFYTSSKISATANARDFKFCTLVGNAKSCGEWVFPKWAWSGSREQFLHCGL